MLERISTLGLIPGSDEWRAVRKGIGGSQVGSIVGLNPYQSAYSLWCEMTGRTKPFTGNLATEVGQWMEQFVANKFEEKTGLRVQKSNYVYYNNLFPNQHALPDRICYYRDGADERLKNLEMGLEIKTTSAYAKMKDGQFPEQYYCQCVQYLSVMEYAIWFLAVMVGNNEFHIYQLRRSEDIPVPEWVEGNIVVDEAEIETLRDACNRFMELVETDTPPLADGDDSTTEALDECYPEATDTVADLFEFDGVIKDLLETIERIKELEHKKDSLTNIIKAELGNNERGVCGDYTVRWSNSTRTTVDSKRLKAEMPEVYEKYSKASTSRIFKVK